MRLGRAGSAAEMPGARPARAERRASHPSSRPSAVGPELEERTGPQPHSALSRGPHPHYTRPVSATRPRPLSVLVLVPGTPPHGRLVSRLVLRGAPQIWSAAIVGGKDTGSRSWDCRTPPSSCRITHLCPAPPPRCSSTRPGKARWVPSSPYHRNTYPVDNSCTVRCSPAPYGCCTSLRGTDRPQDSQAPLRNSGPQDTQNPHRRPVSRMQPLYLPFLRELPRPPQRC